MKIRNDKNANVSPMQFAGIVIGIVMALVLSGAFLSVGLTINSGLTNSLNIDANDSYYNASQAVVNGTTEAYTMTGTMQIVLVSVGIIMLLLAAFGGMFLYTRSQQ